jgi:hypothetical protein
MKKYSVLFEVIYDYDINMEILLPAIESNIDAIVDHIGKNGWPVVRFSSDKLIDLLKYIIEIYHAGDEDAAIESLNNSLKAMRNPSL